MPTSNVGQGLGLGSKFTAADAMWINNRNRQSAQKAATNAIDAKEREKASEYVTKYIDVNNSGINPIWAGKAKEQTTKYLNDFYTGMRLDPNYAKSTANIKAFQDLAANLDKWKIASENLGKTAQLAYTHPEDVEVDAQVNEAINSGDYAKWEAVAKAKGVDPDTYSLGFGTLAKPNMIEHNKHVMNGVYGTTRPSMKEVQEGDFIAAYQVDNGNIPAYEANAIRLYNSDPLAKAYFEAKGTGFEGYKALLEKPLPQSKFSHVSQKQKGGSGGSGNSFGNKSGMVNVKSYTRGDGATVYEIKDNTASNDPKILEIPLLKGKGKGFGIRDPKVIEKGGKLFVEGTEMAMIDSDDGTIASSFSPTTRKIVIEIPKDDTGVGIMNKLSNMYGNVSNAKLDNGEWVMGINENINLRNWDKSGIKEVKVKSETPKAGTPKKSGFNVPTGVKL